MRVAKGKCGLMVNNKTKWDDYWEVIFGIHDDYEEIHRWLCEHGNSSRISTQQQLFIKFTDRDTEMLFKLTWG